jgi:hypothetical protein
MSERCDLSPVALPCAAAPIVPIFRACGQVEVAESAAGEGRTLEFAAPGGPAEIELLFPHDDTGAYFLDRVSLPACWLPERGIERARTRLILASPDLAQVAALEASRPVSMRLSRGEIALGATLGAGERLRLSVRTDGELLPRGGMLVGTDPPRVAASFYCAYFAVLATVAAARFGAPFQDRRRILEHLGAIREELDALGRPVALELLGEDGVAAGYAATWRARTFVMLAGRALALCVQSGTTRVDVLGEGALTLALPEDARNFTAYALDRYGRPTAVWGGRVQTLPPLALAPAESIMLATSPEYR